MSTSAWPSEPLRTLYKIGFYAINIPRLLLLSLRYTIAPLRAVPQWSYRHSMGIAMLRVFFRYLAMTRFQRPRQLAAGKSEDRFVLIAPPDERLFRGVIGAPLAATKPAPAGAVWHPTRIEPGGGDRNSGVVVIFAAGGSFVLGWDPELNATNVSTLATKHFGATSVLYMRYRLASDENPFPAAVQDIFTTYQHVMGLGAPPEDIVLMGDSAGANLVLALLRYLAEQALPQPGGAVIFSPWVEVTSDAVQRYSRSIASRYDTLDVPLLAWGVDVYRPKLRDLKPEEEAYISPLNHPFRLDTPLYMDAGGLEGIYESISTFARQMMDVEGNKVQFHTSVDLPHDFFLLYPVLGTGKEAGMALEQARSFLGR
ncbi:Alpha/Beta hydrolase protein [Hypoxylon sp. FL1284]|nr:Alpha/Beta hydrolase protein [Hypoxylon sp. FL1284]